MRFTSKYIIINCAVLTLTSCLSAFGREITGRVVSRTDGEGVIGAYVSMFERDSLLQVVQSDAEGLFSLDVTDSAKCSLTVTALGYRDVEIELLTDTISSPLKIYMDENDGIALGEVVVSADKSQMVRRTANGQIFYLSKDAKDLKNPFQALQEVPLLIADEANSTVTMLDGKTPLILIDGNRVNSGIAPLNPSEIESVEVVNVVPARYLQEGYDGIINIKLKKHAGPYLWAEAATRHELPLHNGFGVGYFEVGNQKYSLYGRGVYNYTHNDDTDRDTWREAPTYSQQFISAERNNGHSWIGELLFKWNVAPKDYIALHGYINRDHTSSHTTGAGEYTADDCQPYSFTADDRNDGTVVTSSLYYKHTFEPSSDNILEVRAAYNHNSNTLDSWRTEQYGSAVRPLASSFDNLRNSGNVDVDYSKSYASGISMSLGNHLSLQSDRIHQISSPYPIFRHRKLNEYLFGSVSGKIHNLYYLASLGLEMIWLKAGETDNDYMRPRASLSCTWAINSNNSLQLGYTLSNETPQIAQLNPYDTSTDPLLVVSGNPYLKPQTTHRANLNYTLSRGNLYLQPSLSYRAVSDMIETGGYMVGDVYHSTYLNTGHFSQLTASVYASYRFRWGRIGIGGGWSQSYYKDAPARGAFLSMMDFNARAGRFSFYANVDYTNREIGKTSVVHNLRPTMAQVQVNYNITPDFYIALCLQNITGEVRTRTVLDDGAYHSITHTNYRDRNLRPWILLRYTFRKNPHRKIDLGNNILNAEEEGIRLTPSHR